MKPRILFFFMAVILLLTGCSSEPREGTLFYYCRDPEQYRYFEEDGVIHPESRDLLNHRNDLRYMVSLYLAGPMEEGVVSPFTKATKLISAELHDDVIYIELSGHNTNLTDSEFSLACTCLMLTCMDYMPCQAVSITSGERTLTMDAQSILLYDDLPRQETTGGEQ